MRPEERVVRERFELGHEGREDERDTGCRDHDAPARDAASTGEPGNRESEDGREADGLDRWKHPATVTSASRV